MARIVFGVLGMLVVYTLNKLGERIILRKDILRIIGIIFATPLKIFYIEITPCQKFLNKRTKNSFSCLEVITIYGGS